MIKNRHIKPHDFVSGKPKSNLLSWLTAIQSLNPCREITLGVDPIDCVLGGGLEAGELGVIMAPPSVGKTMTLSMIREYLNNVQEQPRIEVVNLDYTTLYPQAQRTYNYTDIRPDGYENWTDAQKFAHKILLNSSY